MKAVIEQMVITIKDGNLDYQASVEYAESVISEIVERAIREHQETNKTNGHGGEGRNVIQNDTRIPAIPFAEAPFTNEETIGEM